MYEQYFGFRQPPFSISPNPAFLFPAAQYQEAVSQLRYGLNKEGGFIVLTGEVGTGKTTLCRYLVKKLPERVHTICIWNSALSLDDLLTHILAELKVLTPELECASRYQKTEAIVTMLRHHHSLRHKTLLIIEEAQDLSLEALETLRLLTNIETDTSKLVHILLVGQPELNVTLSRPDLRQLTQRVIARYHLRPLTRTETANYVIHRLTHVGGQSDIFGARALRALHESAGGIPRLINLIADRSLQQICDDKAKQATVGVIEAAATRIRGDMEAVAPAPMVIPPYRPALMLAGAAVAIAALGWVASRHLPFTAAPLAAPAADVAAPAVEAVPAVNVEAALLTLWQLPHNPAQSLCAQAESQQLRCLALTATTLDELRQRDYPALLQLDGAPALLQRIDDARWTVLTASGPRVLAAAALQARWDGSATLLWRPPAGFMADLREGSKSVPTVFWLQDALNTLGRIEGKVITGGVYTGVLAEKVRDLQADYDLPADGVLTVATAMLISRLLGGTPTLIESVVGSTSPWSGTGPDAPPGPVLIPAAAPVPAGN